MLAGNRQDVNHAGAHVLVPVTTCHRRVFAEQQGRRHAALLCRQSVLDLPLPPTANDGQPATEGARPTFRDPSHRARHSMHAQLGANPLVAESTRVIKFTGISWIHRRGQTARYLHFVTDVHGRNLGGNEQPHAATNRPPAFLGVVAR